jgi:hypothetical protein
MKQSRIRRIIGLGVAGAALCLSLADAASAQVPVVTIATFSDHYVYGGRYFDDLDRLEDAVVAARPRGVRLEACGKGTARALGAAAHRFRNLYLDLRLDSVDDTSCATATAARAVPVSHRFGPLPYGINDEAVDHWWHTISMP